VGAALVHRVRNLAEQREPCHGFARATAARQGTTRFLLKPPADSWAPGPPAGLAHPELLVAARQIGYALRGRRSAGAVAAIGALRDPVQGGCLPQEAGSRPEPRPVGPESTAESAACES
jgi:hypothetical protein